MIERLTTAKSQLVHFLPVFVTAVFMAVLAYFSPVSNTGSDPRFGLLVSQAMLQHQTVRMEVYQEVIAPIKEVAFVSYGGHTYYYFPLGTPLFSLPAVWAANVLGFDMANERHEVAAQNVISAVVVALSFLALYYLGRTLLPAGIALAVTATVFLGSTLISTMSTALWSIDFAVLFVSLSLLLLARESRGQTVPQAPYLLGFFLFAAYLCRPSTFLFVGLVLVYLWLANRKMFWRTAIFSFGLLLAFLLFIRLAYEAWLPPYYNDFGRLAVERRPLWEAMAGNLVSPSRGLLIYSPFLLLTFGGAAVYFDRLKKQPLFWLVITWPGLHMLLVARTTRWWGGASFGPRLLTEMLPALFLLTALIGQIFLERPLRGWQRFSVVLLYGGLAAWGVFLNSYQGLFNPYTSWWNGLLSPSVDQQPEYLWDWKYPQFLADNETLCRHDREFIEQVLKSEWVSLIMSPYTPGSFLTVLEPLPAGVYKLAALDDQAAGGEEGVTQSALSPSNDFSPLPLLDGNVSLSLLLSGWSNPEVGFRWSMCESAMIAFKLDDQAVNDQAYELSLASGSFGEQRANIWLNGREVGQVTFNSLPESPDVRSLNIPPGWLKPGEINQLIFELPDSRMPDSSPEKRRLGLALTSFAIRASP